ncbi:hypothetical protein O181_061351 [Austropuccinia psidii MF-1]|uniref:Reverse transcriptase Ty1/copia-type domain-containing protein n=1 Tax=Austropuccinia psidii MF-1 TaxID=1389203 RepID=A0A9Q3HXE9_9BASI|nr:hypothetical protein [Austropuccinia psidii MF-1]
MAPRKTHWDILDHLMGYLFRTQAHQLVLRPERVSLSLWGGDLECLQSSFMLKLANAPILWGSKQQGVVALSTCAAEYVALSDSTEYLVQAIYQLKQLAGDFYKGIFCNNQVAVQVSIDNLSRKCMQYLYCAFFFFNDVIQKHNIKVTWVLMGKMQADQTGTSTGPPLPMYGWVTVKGFFGGGLRLVGLNYATLEYTYGKTLPVKSHSHCAHLMRRSCLVVTYKTLANRIQVFSPPLIIRGEGLETDW